MNRKRTLSVGATLVAILMTGPLYAAGISVDAGLTPPEDRWILRNQYRTMTRRNDPTAMNRHMRMFMVPTVLAYGVTSDLALMVRQGVRHSVMDMLGTSDTDTGLDDLFLLGKFKVFRRNTREYTFGVAATLGMELPTGADEFTSDTWDVVPGVYSSWRSGSWAADLQVAYQWNGFADRGPGGLNPGNEFQVDTALAYQFDLTEDSSVTLAPVLELSYLNVGADQLAELDLPNTGENVLYLSPGVKYTQENFILEALVRIPVWQDQEGTRLERGVALIIGTRLLF